MSERPTPETDDQPTINAINNNGYQVPCVDIEYARKLERERDDAFSQIVQAECRAERFCQERDEARELCRELVDLVAYGLGQNGSFWSQAAMRQAREKIQKAKALEAK